MFHTPTENSRNALKERMPMSSIVGPSLELLANKWLHLVELELYVLGI